MNKVVPNIKFHPSIFEILQEKPVEERSMALLREQRSQRLTEENVEKLESPGTYGLTVDDKKIGKTNTNQLFKNIHEETLLTHLFFSEKNVETIQNLIKLLVHKETGYVLDKQSYTELLIVMRSIFLEYNAHPPLISDTMDKKTQMVIMKKYTDEIIRLNDIVLNTIVPRVISQLQQYLDYLRDASEQPYYMERPNNVNATGQKQYRSVTQVLIGGDL